MKNFFHNLKVAFHDLDLYIRDDKHISKKAKIGLLIFVSVLTIFYVANYYYLKAYENSYSNITELVNRGEYRVAHEKLVDILKKHPNDPYFLILDARANIGLSEGRYNNNVKKSYLARSLSLLKKAEELNSKIVEIYRFRGLTYLYLGNFDLAELAYKKMLTLNNKDSAGWTNLGDIYLLQGNITSAGDSFNKAIELDQNNEQAFLGHIKILFAQNRFDRVVNLGVSLYVKTSDFRIKLQLAEILGSAYSKLTKYTDAKRYFEDGLRLDPNSVSINYGLAELSFYSSFNIKEPVESTNDSKRRAISVVNLDSSYPYSYALLTRIASVTNNKADYDKYLEFTKEKINSYAFMNQSQKDLFLKTLPLFNKASKNVKIRVTSVKSTPSTTGDNVNTLISK